MNASGELQILPPRFLAGLHGEHGALPALPPGVRTPLTYPPDEAVAFEIVPLEYQTGAALRFDD